MKTFTVITAIFCLAITSVGMAGQEPTDTPRPPEEQRGSGGETRLLQHLLQMDAQQLADLRQTIERIEKMSPEERAQLSERIGKIHDMPPGKIDAMRKKYEAIPEEQREAMRKRWMEMNNTERSEWRKKLRKMTDEERQAIFEEQEFMPPPPPRDKKGPRFPRPEIEESQEKTDVQAPKEAEEKIFLKNKIDCLTE
jgi:hypothetical protein